MVALTKCDKLNKTERAHMMLQHCEQITACGAIPVIAFSAVKGDGAEELRKVIARALER